jgi:hypothetical protein
VRWAWAGALLVALSLAAATSGCRGCKREGPPPESSEVSAPVVTERAFAIAPARLLSPPDWSAEHSLRGIGLPVGCRAELPIHTAELPERAHFVTASSALGWLAIGTGSDNPNGRTLEARALIDLESRRTGDLPWHELDAPPLVERASGAWLAALSAGNPGERQSALLWREAKPALELARGDRLEIADFVCSGDRCALLTTLARAAAAPGALVISGDPRRTDGWQQAAIEPDPSSPWQPLSIARFDGGTSEVALSDGRSVALWRVAASSPEKLGELAAPFGAWEVVMTPVPVLISAGASLDAGCRVDAFPLRLSAFGGASHEVTIGVAPHGVIARPITQGALVAWVAPVSCQLPERTVVHLLRVDERGAPSGAPMAVADASGFALSTAGNRVSLWLRTKSGITWIRAVC